MLCSAAKNVGSALEDLYALRGPMNCLESILSPLINIARYVLVCIIFLLTIKPRIKNSLTFKCIILKRCINRLYVYRVERRWRSWQPH